MADRRRPTGFMTMVCSWCKAIMGQKTAVGGDVGSVTHGICADCREIHFDAPLRERKKKGQ